MLYYLFVFSSERISQLLWYMYCVIPYIYICTCIFKLVNVLCFEKFIWPDLKCLCILQVCQTCFEEGQVQEGQRRRLTEYFHLLRQQGTLTSTVTKNGKISKNWRHRYLVNYTFAFNQLDSITIQIL
jgi:CTP synthase (UTP-ammonia lyase)